MRRLTRWIAFAVGVVIAVGLAAPAVGAAPSPAATSSVPPPPISLPALDGGTTTAPAPAPVDAPGADKPGFFDLSGRVREAVNSWFRSLVVDAMDPILDFLARTVFATPEFTDAGRVRDLWWLSWGIANTAFVLLIVAGGALLIGHDTFSTRYTVKELAPRIVVGWVAANASLAVVGIAIELANALSSSFLEGGIGGATGAADTVGLVLEGALATGGIFVVLLGLAVVVLGVGLAVTYLARIATLVVLVAAAPLLLAGYALPATQGAARMWWRALVGCLGVQVAQSLVLVTAIRVFFDTDGQRALGLPGGSLVDLLVVGCLFWVLLKLPSYARHLVFQPRANAGLQLVRQYVVSRAVRTAATAVIA